MTPYKQIVALLPIQFFFHRRSIFYNVDLRHHSCKIKATLDNNNNNNNLYGPSKFTVQMQLDLSIIVVPVDKRLLKSLL